RHGHGHRQVGLSRSRGPDPEDDVMGANGVDVALLPQALGRDDAVATGDENGVEEDLPERGVRSLGENPGGLLHVLRVERIACPKQVVERPEHRFRQPRLLFLALDRHLGAAVTDAHARGLLEEAKILVLHPGERLGEPGIVEFHSAGDLGQGASFSSASRMDSGTTTRSASLCRSLAASPSEISPTATSSAREKGSLPSSRRKTSTAKRARSIRVASAPARISARAVDGPFIPLRATAAIPKRRTSTTAP